MGCADPDRRSAPRRCDHRRPVGLHTQMLRPVHTPLDGDIVFVGATGQRALADPSFSLSELGALAADVVARAIARGVYEARALPFPGALPAWRDHFSAR